MGNDLADMHLISKFDKGFRFLVSVIDIYGKHPLVASIKDRKDNKYYCFLENLR